MLDKVKLFLSITDDLQDDLILEILENTKTQLLNIIQIEQIPASLEYMILEYTLYKMQILGNEATTSEKIFEQSTTYIHKSFREYFKDDLHEYMLRNKNKATFTTLF